MTAVRGRSWLLLLSLGACAGSPPPEPDPQEARLAAQAARIAELEGRLQAAEAERDALQARLAEAEQRLGLRPFAPRVLKAVDGGLRFEAGRASVVDAPGARARQADVAKHGARYPAYVVAYWATWCKPCTTPEEIAALGELQRELDALGSALVGVAVDELPTVTGHARAAEWFYPIWQRKDAHLEWLPKAFIDRAGLGLPLFLVVSGDGRLRYWHNAALDPAARRELVTAAVAPSR